MCHEKKKRLLYLFGDHRVRTVQGSTRLAAFEGARGCSQWFPLLLPAVEVTSALRVFFCLYPAVRREAQTTGTHPRRGHSQPGRSSPVLKTKPDHMKKKLNQGATFFFLFPSPLALTFENQTTLHPNWWQPLGGTRLAAFRAAGLTSCRGISPSDFCGRKKSSRVGLPGFRGKFKCLRLDK